VSSSSFLFLCSVAALISIGWRIRAHGRSARSSAAVADPT
jgi:hypothetical protein